MKYGQLIYASIAVLVSLSACSLPATSDAQKDCLQYDDKDRLMRGCTQIIEGKAKGDLARA